MLPLPRKSRLINGSKTGSCSRSWKRKNSQASSSIECALSVCRTLEAYEICRLREKKGLHTYSFSFQDPSPVCIHAHSIGCTFLQPNSQHCRYCLNLKGLPYQSVYIEMSDIEKLTREIGAAPISVRRDIPKYTIPIISPASSFQIRLS